MCQLECQKREDMETERNHLRKKQLSQAKDLEKLRKEINQLKKKNAKSVSLLYVHFIKFSRISMDSQSMNLYKIIPSIQGKGLHIAREMKMKKAR
jgi:hypothetical protein